MAAVQATIDPADARIRTLAELLELVADDQVDAFAEFYQRSSPRVMAIAKSVLRDSHQADEVTQEVYLEIWQHAGSFDASLGSASSWISRIAHSRSVDRVRSAAAVRARDIKYNEQTVPVYADLVVEDVLRRADAHGLHRAMAKVTYLQREALTVTYLLGHTQREASVILQIPLATLKTRVRDGLQRLRCGAL
jgi:RNA polymerase sigma-70 factor (ECF subfamily)